MKIITATVGDVRIGEGCPIVVQTMCNTHTSDVEASVAQCRRMHEAGAGLIRLTVPSHREVEALREIKSRLRAEGIMTPLVADVHFSSEIAIEAAGVVEKVRINPGNFHKDHIQAQAQFSRLVEVCKRTGTALRIGLNHGSLGTRITEMYGNTPFTMKEAAMEWIDMCIADDFYNVVVSLKASNTAVMVEAYRLLYRAMEETGIIFPLHLGVTEAGDGEDGRIKSAVGMGALLSEGVGDTIRVSLSEDPEFEIPVARKLVDYIASREGHPYIKGTFAKGYNHIVPERRVTYACGCVGGNNQPVVVSSLAPSEMVGCALLPDLYLDSFDAAEVDASQPAEEVAASLSDGKVIILSSSNQNPVGEMQAFIHGLTDCGCKVPVVARMRYEDADSEDVQVKAGADFGTLLINRLIDGILLDAPNLPVRSDSVRFAFGILQAARTRMVKTEFISCPSCGRTMFNLQETVREIKAATSHLKGLKIGIMGCIVNGPGEMADADYGYVGAAAGKVSLYKGKECVERNIPQEDALEHLISLIKANGDWHDKSSDN